MYNPKENSFDDEPCEPQTFVPTMSEVMIMDQFRIWLSGEEEKEYTAAHGPEPMGQLYGIDKEAWIIGGICLIGCFVMSIVL